MISTAPPNSTNFGFTTFSKVLSYIVGQQGPNNTLTNTAANTADVFGTNDAYNNTIIPIIEYPSNIFSALNLESKAVAINLPIKMR